MKKFYFLFICFWLLAVLAHSQTLITGEYFIDKDPGFGKGIAISFNPADTIKGVSVPVNSVGLSVGYHYVFIRVRNSYGHWGNYRQQRFYVYNNDSIKPNNDSVYLVQAEYFIDTVPTPGKGKLIDLPHVSSISYDDSIPGFVADNFIHSVGVRVKDNKGAWSFIKADTVPTGGMEISVTSSPYLRQNEKTKYTITLKNKRSTDLYDVFLIVRPTNLPNTGAVNASLDNDVDTINGIDVKNVSPITRFNDQQYIPIWIYSIPSQTEKTFDFYMNVFGEFGHQILNQSFEIYYDFIDRFKPSFRTNGDTTDFINSRVFSVLYNTIYLEQNSISAFNIDDSLINRKLDSSFKLINNLFDEPIMFNKIIKPVVNSSFKLDISDSLTNFFATDCIAFLRQSFFADDNPIEADSVILKTQRISCENQCSIDCPLPFPPLYPIEDFIIKSIPCVPRCYCVCEGNKETNINRPHGGIDISINPKASKNTRYKWSNYLQEIYSIYDGIVSEVGWENKNQKIGFGYRVIVESKCNGVTFFTTYGHLTPYPAVRKGDPIKAGEIVGFAGRSGFATGPHLHLEIRYGSGETCDPNYLFSFFGYETDKDAGPSPCPIFPDIPCLTKEPRPCEEGKTYPFLGFCEPQYVAASCIDQEHITPKDPNDKTGNKGYAIPQYISKNEQLHYGILFENKDSASASAQVVTIKDTLDKNKIDVSSLKIESVTAGEMLIVLPDSVNIQNLDTIYSKQPINGTYVRVQTNFDTLSGLLGFTMTSLDTLTLEPVTDPLAGFLPPDTTNFDGNGLVSFKVMPKSTIADGTVIYNTAHIIFDKNPSIATGTWFNTIDNKAPSSYVKQLPEITYDTSFTVSWKGADSGAGIIYYDIYSKKKSDTAYAKWLSATSDTSAIFTGQLDSTYQFYSIAYDSLLNIEAAPDTADATSTISSEVLPINLISFNSNCSQNNVSLEWVTGNESGIKYFTIEKSMNATNWISTGRFINAKNNQLQNQYKTYDAYNGYTYYRLGITEKDGSTSYSSVLKINCGKLVNSMQAYPVPAKNLLNVLIQADKNAPTNLVLTDTYGRIIKRVNVNIKEGTNNFSLDITNVANGNYILRADGTINLNSQKIIIIK